ncbi:phage tail tape measure protein [Pseudoxanthomonas wuyuanensis]|uniref:Phage tail tape measure protein, TP901 family, core region n=1 Tax=Pseudoxanthomonas wuyuanensis TaxID=1073196 RepID=A0A286D4T5_9GAMM|nr:phage tail tape measure protein [Pseudoxanthomonas wuyuanensis]KAF1719796.1 phage tail tape measure protein [Pseudoxanthomonas wuyuanensis]SOD53653.1 phage tail tape measure protein, TP901 family, core region [Pseudoxanthomonas wuyuanensis]
MGGNELKLSVVLAAIDKATGPFRRIMAGSKGVANAIRTQQSVLRKLNHQQRAMDSFRSLETQVGGTSQALQAQRRHLAELTAQYNRTAEPSKKLTRELKHQAAHLGKLVQQEDRQRNALAAQRQALAASGIDTHRLAVHQHRLSGEIDTANRKLGEQKAQLGRLQRASATAAKIHRAGMSTALHGAGAAFAGQRALQAEMLPLAKAMAFESAMADVRKVVDFPTPEAFRQMGWDVQDLSRRLPMLPEQIAQIVAAAGQAGIARSELLRFAEDATQMGVAFDTTAEDAGQTMATWRTAFRMNQDAVVQLADRINYLGNTGPANVRQISEVVNRIGALGEVAGLQSGPLAALASTVAGMGIQSEVSATGIKNMLLTLASGSAATKRQRAAFKAIDVDAVQMARSLQDDAGGAIMSVLQKLRQLPKAEQAATMTTLFGRESIGAIAPLLTNLELLATNFDKVADAQQYAGSMQAEYAARVATSENTLQLLKNTALVMAQSIGQTLIPDFKTLATRTSEVVGRAVEWIRANPELVRGIARVVVGGTALVTVLGGLLVAGGFAAMAFSQIHHAVAILSGGQGFMSLLGTLGQLAGRVLPWLLNGTRLLLPLLGGVSAPVLAIGAAIALVAALVWKYWEPIKAFMVGVWQGLSDAAAPVMAELRTALAPLAPLWDMISGAMGKAWNWIEQLFAPFQASNEQLQAATGYGRTFGQMLGTVLTTSIGMLVKGVGWMASAFMTVHSVIVRVMGGIWSYVQGAWSLVTGIFSGDGVKIRAGLQAMWSGINQVLAGWPAKMMQAGVDMVTGLINGIKSMLGKAGDAISGVGGGVITRFKSLLGIRSPSRVFAQFGQFTMQGFANGLVRAQGGPLQAMAGMGQRLRQAGAGVALGALAAPAVAVDHREPITSVRPVVQTGGDTFHITIQVGAGAPAQDIALAVRAEIERLQREKQARTRSRLGDYED